MAYDYTKPMLERSIFAKQLLAWLRKIGRWRFFTLKVGCLRPLFWPIERDGKYYFAKHAYQNIALDTFFARPLRLMNQRQYSKGLVVYRQLLRQLEGPNQAPTNPSETQDISLERRGLNAAIAGDTKSALSLVASAAAVAEPRRAALAGLLQGEIFIAAGDSLAAKRILATNIRTRVATPSEYVLDPYQQACIMELRRLTL